MSGEPVRETKEEPKGERVRRNLLNIGIFMAELLALVLIGPWAIRFFLPVIAGWLIAQLANPLVHFLEKHLHIIRKHSSVGIIVGAILLIVLACYYAASWCLREIMQFLERLPVYYRALVDGLNQIGRNLQGFTERLSPEMQERISQFMENSTDYLGRLVGSLGGGTVEAAGNAAKNIPSLLISFIFVLLFAYFFIAQQERVQRIARRVIPDEIRGYLKVIWSKLKTAVGGYFRAQFKIMGIVLVMLVVGFLLMRIEYAVLLAVVVAILDFLPMLGTGTVLIPWALFCALSGAVPRAVGLIVLYGVTQATRQLIQPKMVGDSVGIDTMTTLSLMFVGYRLSGILGMIVAIPAGLIVIQFYEAGAFDFLIQNIKELAESIEEWRFGGKK